jgi:hypothetical protein
LLKAEKRGAGLLSTRGRRPREGGSCFPREREDPEWKAPRVRSSSTPFARRRGRRPWEASRASVRCAGLTDSVSETVTARSPGLTISKPGPASVGDMRCSSPTGWGKSSAVSGHRGGR